MKQILSSIRTRILVATGSVVILIMMSISLAILFKWRSVIIEKEIYNDESVANAFTIPVIDALIYAEKEDLQKEDVLETYIDNYIEKIKGIKYILIVDNKLRVAAQREKENGIISLKDQLSSELVKTETTVSSIMKSKNGSWIIEVTTPLEIAGRSWGVVRIGFEAETIRQQIAASFSLLLALTILVTIGTLSVLFFLISKITSSLNKLVVEIDKISFDSEEEFHFPESRDEIGFLVFHFNKLKKRLSLSKKQLEEAQRQIYQSEKLASIGRLASGVAHEINNPINGIKNCLYAITKEPDNHQQTREYLKLIDEGINYIENVIQKLLGFARQQSASPGNVDLNDLVMKVTRLLKYRLDQKRTSLRLELEEMLPGMKADGQLLQEVIMNLLINSLDAIQEGGQITISTRVPAPGITELTVSDNGIGIDQENMGRIFDPFYTTKEPGVGTGLGLSVCLGIVEQHGGSVKVESEPGKETKFTVLLPSEVKDENTIS